jgi:ABC-type microcin C transport system permease subunit YejB
MAYLHDGSVYQPGQGLRLTAGLRSAFLPEEAIKREVAEILERYVRSDYAEGFGADVVVADLIVRQLITSREVALGVLAAAKAK